MCIIQKFFAAIDKKWILTKMNKYHTSKCIFIIYNSTTVPRNFADELFHYDFSAGPNCVKITVERESTKNDAESYTREFLPGDLKTITLMREIADIKRRMIDVEHISYANYSAYT